MSRGKKQKPKQVFQKREHSVAKAKKNKYRRKRWVSADEVRAVAIEVFGGNGVYYRGELSKEETNEKDTQRTTGSGS